MQALLGPSLQRQSNVVLEEMLYTVVAAESEEESLYIQAFVHLETADMMPCKDFPYQTHLINSK